MRNIYIVSMLLGILPLGALAQTEFSTSDGARVQGVVIECAAGVSPVACGNSTMPLVVDSGMAATGASMPAGGSGVLGFLSGIYGVLVAGQRPTVVAVDCSALLGVSPTAVIAAGTLRKSFMLENIGTANIGFSLTSATPVLGGTQTFTLQPGGSYSSPSGMSFASAIFAVAAAAGSQLACTYFN